jgi:hypothetical protein
MTMAKTFDYSKYEGEDYKAPHYKEDWANKFVQQMLKAGLWPFEYHGRFYWHGPAVTVDDIQDAMSVTKVRMQWDNLGRGWVVYPKQSATLIKEEVVHETA